MSALELNAIATRLLLDEGFQQALLKDQDRECLAPFHLTDNERTAILTIRSKNTYQFIDELNKLMHCSATDLFGNS